MENHEKIIIGIDPGTNIMGYAVIRITNKNAKPKSKSNKIELIVLDVLKLGKLQNHALKLKKIFETSLRLMTEYKPDELAIEAPFYGKNVQSMLKLGRAQGVAIAAALYREIPIFEYSPKKVKQSITGNGSASKEQVAAMVMNLLEIKDKPKYLDATDALGIAVCHYFQNTGERQNLQDTKYSGWKAFIEQNPKRLSGK